MNEPTTLSIYRALRAGKRRELEARMQFMTPGLCKWVRDVIQDTEDCVWHIQEYARWCYSALAGNGQTQDRKALASAIQSDVDFRQIAPFLFRIFDGKGMDDLAWAYAEPEGCFRFNEGAAR